MKLYRYRLPFREPIKLRSEDQCDREGLLIETPRGWGEAAPLPGFSRETLGDAIAALQTGPSFSLPSLRFAWESADEEISAVDVSINALLFGDRAKILQTARELAASKCRAVKLKVGRAVDPQDDAALVQEVRECLRADQALRLDANRAWNFDHAISFGLAVSGLAIEYIEEPVADPNRLEEFWQRTGCPYALDETLVETHDMEPFRHSAALVVKPTLLGGYTDIEPLRRHNKPLVFSACYESGVGIAHIARLVMRCGRDVPAGLDTYSRLADDVLRGRLDMCDWRLSIKGPLSVDRDKLEEIVA